MLTRIITAIAGIVIGIIIVLLSDTIVLDIAVAALAVMIVYELLSNCKCLQYKIHSAVCFAFAAALPFLTHYCGQDTVYIFSFVCIILMMTVYIMSHKRMNFDKLCFMLSTSLLSSMAMCCIIRLKIMGLEHGKFYIVICLAAAWLSDGAAYFVGTFFGKHKLCPDISPKKTVEGAFGGVLGGTAIFIVFIVVYKLIQASNGVDISINYVWSAAVGIICGLLSIVGDLTASLIKRQNDIKDFGNIMPGHGGVMDRFDSVLFVAPFMALAFEYIKPFG